MSAKNTIQGGHSPKGNVVPGNYDKPTSDDGATEFEELEKARRETRIYDGWEWVGGLTGDVERVVD